MDLRKSMGIGPRTRKNILKGKNIRKDEHGVDVFEDYFSESDETTSICTKSSHSATADQVNRNLSNVVVEEQQPTIISAISISKAEFLESNDAESENTTSNAPFKKSSLLLKEVSEFHPKKSVQMQNILPEPDDVDQQIMKLVLDNDNITDKNDLSRKRNLKISKANKTLLENSKSHQEKSTVEEIRGYTRELPSSDECDECDLELLGKKLQNASYVSPSKQLNEKDIATSSPEDVESDAAVEKNSAYADVSSDNHTSNVGNTTTPSGRLRKRAPYTSPKSHSKINSTSHVKHVKSKSISDSPNKNISNVSLHNIAVTNSSEHNQPIYENSNSADNSFTQISTQKRKTAGKKGKEKEQIVSSEHIQPINATYNCIDNSYTQIIAKKRKTTVKNRNEQINSTKKQIYQRKGNITSKKDLSRKKNFNISKGNKELVENSKSHQEKNMLEELGECTGELPCAYEYNLRGKMQSASYVSPNKHYDGKGIAVNSPEDSESDAAIEKDTYAHVSSDNCIPDVSFKTTSHKLKKKSPYAASKNLNEINSTYCVNHLEKTNNILTRSKLGSVSPNKDISNISLHNNAVANSPEHNQSIYETNNVINNSFKQVSTPKRKTIEEKGNENEQVNSSEHIQPINTANSSTDNSFKQISTQKRKTARKGNENEQINCSEHIQTLNTSNINIDNSKQLSAKRRKTIVKKRNEQINATKKQNKGRKHSSNSRKSLNSTRSVRRSGRQRFEPLARWRNERLIYRCVNGELKFLGIDKGTNEDDKPIQYLYKRYEIMQRKKKIIKPKKAGLINIAENKMCVADIIKKFSFTPWNVSEEEMTKVNRPYFIKRMFETEKNGFGFLQIDINKEKPEQYMPEDDLHLTVVRGNVELTIQKNSYKVSEKDMFIIPRNCAYSIKNIGKIKALLSYVVGKFQFLESLKV